MEWNEEEYQAFAQKMEVTYPIMYGGMYGGFAIGKGWWHIIERLSANIDSRVRWKNEMAKKFPEKYEECPPVTVHQIKEKFGGLRFYYEGGDDYVAGLVTMAESWAATTCETCGERGKFRSGGWMRTLCDVHEEERQRGMKERFGDEDE